MRKHVSLALHLRDGYKNKPIGGIAQLAFYLDGDTAACLPIFKEGGWCIFINLAPGDHTLKVLSTAFSPLTLSFTLKDENDYHERYHILSPTPAYPFQKRVDSAMLTLTRKKKPYANEEVLLLMKSEHPLKIAQDGLKEGESELKLYFPGKVGIYMLPAMYFIHDKDKSECVMIIGAKGDVCELSEPLACPHSRGTPLYRVRTQCTDAQGRLFLLFEDSRVQTLCVKEKAAFKMHDIELPADKEACVEI